MTPTAVTPAARTSRQEPTRPAGHRSPLKRPTAPRGPRRVSGPAAKATTVRPAPTRPAPTRPAPTRPTRPTRPARARPRRPRAAQAPRVPLTARSLAHVRALPDHPLLDRVVRGRTWIPLLGVLLVGIVAMQVEVLKLNAGIGTSLARAATLQSQNQLLRSNVARLSDDQRIESAAAHMGMVMAPPAAIRFLPGGGAGTVDRALAGIHQPNASGFAAQLAASQTATQTTAPALPSTGAAAGGAPTTAAGG